jgi:F-type H+-transporting ATPase subunit delta
MAKLGRADLRVAEDLLAAGRIIGSSKQLRAALADAEADAAQKRKLIEAVFGSKLTADAITLLADLTSNRWSKSVDLLEGIEELGFRIASESAPDVPIESELFTIGQAVASDAGLELALGSKLNPADSKVQIVDRLLSGKASPQTVAIVNHLVQQPRGGRIGELIRHAADIVAQQRGFGIVTVTTAAPLAATQLDRLVRGLEAQYGRALRVNTIVDPSVIGGVRVQIGDDVIDGSVASRLSTLRQKLAG